MTTNRLYTITECALFALACVMIVLLVGCAPEEVAKHGVYGSYHEWNQFLEKEAQ